MSDYLIAHGCTQYVYWWRWPVSELLLLLCIGIPLQRINTGSIVLVLGAT
jgi:hypothetical protein